MEELQQFYEEAYKFTMENHSKDLLYLENLRLQTDFSQFLREYIYVVIASGFKGKVAANIVDKVYEVIKKKGYDNPQLYDSLLEVFKNQTKIKSICKTIDIFRCQDAYDDFLQKSGIQVLDHELYNDIQRYMYYITNIRKPEQLSKLPFIGPVTCYHLSRNLGIKSTVKPDLHLCRLVSNIFNIQKSDKELERITILKIEELAEKVNKKPGCVDFCLWVYLSHQKEQKDCCHNDKIRLR